MSNAKDEERGLVDEEEEYEDEEDIITKTQRAASCYEDADAQDMEHVPLDEDTFGMSVCSLTRDTWHLSKSGCSCARITRLLTSLFLVIVTISMQIMVLKYVKEYVSAKEVHGIRRIYQKYEFYVYGCGNDGSKGCGKDGNDPCMPDCAVRTCSPTEYNATRCYLTENLKFRGYPDNFPGEQKAREILYKDVFTDDDRSQICHIPLSQPDFFRLILIIWVLTCFQEMKKACDLGWILAMLPKISDMTESVEEGDDGIIIVGMTFCMKAVLILLTFIPRIGVTLYLLWVGMRWLLATTAFSDLILNAVALEFVLCIKEVIYTAVMPTRSHFDLTKTMIVPHPRKLSAAWFNFTGSVSLLLVAVLVVVVYMRYLQQVLPEYNWDVQGPCALYIKREYCLGADCLKYGQPGTAEI